MWLKADSFDCLDNPSNPRELSKELDCVLLTGVKKKLKTKRECRTKGKESSCVCWWREKLIFLHNDFGEWRENFRICDHELKIHSMSRSEWDSFAAFRLFIFNLLKFTSSSEISVLFSALEKCLTFLHPAWKFTFFSYTRESKLACIICQGFSDLSREKKELEKFSWSIKHWFRDEAAE